MLDEIGKLIIQAMKAKNPPRLAALRYLKSMLLENKTSKSPKNEMDVVIGHHKKLKDSLSLYPDGSEQQKSIEAEVEVIAEFLPKQMEQSEVEALIESIKSAHDSPNMGTIMKELSPQIKGKFNGKLASELVKKALS